MLKAFIISLVAVLFIGCSTGELTIAKCEKFENDICVNAKTVVVKECINPINQDGKIYCH